MAAQCWARRQKQAFVYRYFQSIKLFPVFQATKMHQRSWVSRCIIPCPGIDRCEFYKPGEVDHPLQHEVSKVVNEDGSASPYTSSKASVASSIKSNSSNKRLVLSGTFLGNLAPVPFDPKLDPPLITACFNCWRTNHKLNECYFKKRNKFCSNCGRKYVQVEDCPRCTKAYCEYIEEQDHMQAKIELYGGVESTDFYEQRKEPEEFTPAKKTVSPQSNSTGKKDDFWSDSSHGDDSRTSIATNMKTAGFDSSYGKDSKYEDECKNDYKNVSTSVVKEFKTMNLNAKEKAEQETFYNSHHMIDSNKITENYEEHVESNKFVTCTRNSKFERDQFDCEGLKKAEDGADSHNNSLLASKLEDENEDLDDLIFVDEDDNSMESNALEPNVTGDSDQAYQHLLSVIKNLPEAAQKVALHCFHNSQKKQSSMKEF